MNIINMKKIGEAREENEAALESKDAVHFNDEAECARDVVS